MIRWVCFLVGLIFVHVHGQNAVSIHDLEEKIQIENKPIFLFLTTDWCGICQIQHHQISKDEELIHLMNDKIYFVPFNAESTLDIYFNQTHFKKQPNQYHDFVLALFDDPGDISFPTWIILNEKYELIFQYSGLLKPHELKLLIQSL